MYGSIQSFFESIQKRINTLDATITRRENVLSFNSINRRFLSFLYNLVHACKSILFVNHNVLVKLFWHFNNRDFIGLRLVIL